MTDLSLSLGQGKTILVGVEAERSRSISDYNSVSVTWAATEKQSTLF